MSRPATGRRGAGPGPLLLAALLAWPGGALEAAAQAGATPAAGPAPVIAAAPDGPAACGAQAARYEDGKGFGLVVIRAGQVRIENPLRPLTPEVTRVLLVAIGKKVATAYGPDLAALRRGGTPAAIEAQLGGPVRWEAALPALPETLAIVGEDGAALAQLAFRACEEPPAVKVPPQAAKGQDNTRQAGPGQAARGTAKPPAKAPAKPHRTAGPEGGAKAPPGFSLPQGAIAE